jgi:hypothetical protein
MNLKTNKIMKQSAVEWLEEIYLQTNNIDNFDLEVAKEMEKEQQGYSEEDMKDYALKCISNYLFGEDFISYNLRIPIVENNNKQFEKFKNK